MTKLLAKHIAKNIHINSVHEGIKICKCDIYDKAFYFEIIMELISTDDFFILQHLQRSETSLWVCRKTGKFSVRPPWDLAEQENPECLGLVWGLYGKLDIHPDVCQRLGESYERVARKRALPKYQFQSALVEVTLLF